MKKAVIFIAISIMMICLGGCKEESVFPTDKIAEAGNYVEEAATPKYDVTIQVDCTENLFMNKYDVEVSAANEVLGVLEHGKAETYELELEEGTYTFSVCEESDDEELADGKVEFTISENKALKFEVYCRTDQIEITETPSVNPPIVTSELTGQKYKKIVQMYEDAGFTNVKAKPMKNLTSDDMEKKNKVETIKINKKAKFTTEEEFFVDAKVVIKYNSPVEINPPSDSSDLEGRNYKKVVEELKEAGFVNVKAKKEYSDYGTKNKVKSVSIGGDSFFDSDDKFPFTKKVVVTYYVPEEPSPVFYSTNDYETAKQGNTGVFSYVDNGSQYDIYWIIDFDDEYVYYFTDGNGEDFCDKLKIESGNLNTYITITYHDGSTQWSNKLHFKYENHPETLIMVDQNGFEFEYTTTDLDDALILRDSKTIKER